jgi:hypothetical protein
VGAGAPFRFLTEVGEDVAPTYPGLFGVSFNIDHVVTDVLTGACWAAGVTPGHPPVMEVSPFDHTPAP